MILPFKGMETDYISRSPFDLLEPRRQLVRVVYHARLAQKPFHLGAGHARWKRLWDILLG